MKAKIIRLEKSADGVLGSFLLDGKLFCSTLEHPVHLIPFGVYPAKFLPSPNFRRSLYELYDTPHRTEILIHVGNTLKDTKGCILLGRYAGNLGERRAVLNSADTLDEFHQITQGADLALEILDLTPLCEK